MKPKMIELWLITNLAALVVAAVLARLSMLVF